MTTMYKVLGQANPLANTDTTLYTVPADTQVVISTITVCNQSASQPTFRLAVRPNGAALAAQHYLAYDSPLEINDMLALTLGITLGPGDVITVRGSTSSLSFSAFGSEMI